MRLSNLETRVAVVENTLQIQGGCQLKYETQAKKAE
jgi:hypothetical protein